jgi:hypothetical protein
MQSKGMPTLWLTFGAAHNHWKDLQQLGPLSNEQGISKSEAAKRRRKFMKDNQPLVDAFF